LVLMNDRQSFKKISQFEKLEGTKSEVRPRGERIADERGLAGEGERQKRKGGGISNHQG